MKVMAIDPGLSGAFVVTDGESLIKCWPMPISITGKEKKITFNSVNDLLNRIRLQYGRIHIFLERAVSFGMGSKAAFNYGRGFELIEIAIGLNEFPVTLVEPAKWTKEMHEGISADLKAKAKSVIAVQRLFPQLVKGIPKKPRGGIHDGFVDAVLIAGYGLRKLSGPPARVKPEVPDFF